jgi:hypothetical protein
MEFLNPNMLWGLGAIAIPIILHFWHQKRGKVLPWAATQWLNQKAMQQSRGIRLENLILLLLRILLLILLVLFLAKPSLKSSGEDKAKSHWVFPQKSIVDNYKFELEEAKNKGEKRFWLNGEEIKNLDQIPAKTDIQKGINKINLTGNETAEIYISNTADFSRFSKVFVPQNYKLHILKDSSKTINTDYILLENGKKLGLNNQGILTEINTSGKELHSGSFNVLNPTSESGIAASLAAIEEVYGITFKTDTLRESNKKYDLVFANNPDKIQPNDGLIFISNARNSKTETLANNIIYLNDNLSPESSELVFSGGLPELILERLLTHIGLKVQEKPRSNRQIEKWFSERKATTENQWLSPILFLLFLGVLGIERWLAIKKNT